MRRCLALAALTLGCVTVGQPINRAQLEHIEPGVSTRAEVEAMLGPPASVIVDSSGDTFLGWSYTHAGFAGADVGSQTVLVRFGPDGKVREKPTWMASGVDAARAR